MNKRSYEWISKTFCSSLKQGDVVLKKATEYGAVEIWMNERVRRACASSCADFLYGFREVYSQSQFVCVGELLFFLFFLPVRFSQQRMMSPKGS